MEDLGEKKGVRERQKRIRKSQGEGDAVLRVVMSSKAGRRWVWDTLSACHSFTMEPPTDAVAMAFRNGERNVGIRLMTEFMRVAPHEFMLMQQEANGLDDDGTSDDDTDTSSDDDGA